MKKKTWIIVLLVIVFVAVGAGAYYFVQRDKPNLAVKTFLTYMQNMDLDGMESMLQSNDLSALDDADVRNEAYTEFFKSINEKMTFKVTKNQFNIQNGTANVTAHIKYIDGSQIYKETITEFLRQIVAAAFSGTEMTEAETQQKLAAILEEKSQSVADEFSEIDITYPLMAVGGVWKIVALDDETIKIMSANIKNVEDEINQSLLAMETDENTSVSDVPSANPEDLIDMSTEQFTIRYTGHKVANDLLGNSCLLVYYDYTNNASASSSAMVDVSLRAYQNGASCEAAIPESNEASIDNYIAEIQPGETVNVCQAFSLTDLSAVTLQAGSAFSLGGETTTQIISLQ